MLNLNTNLGRAVPTAQQVAEVIRPQMRLARALRVGIHAAMREGWLTHDPDLNLTDGGDDSAETAMFEALRTDAIQSVGQWARDMEMVYDGEKLREFIRQALIAADAGNLVEDDLDY